MPQNKDIYLIGAGGHAKVIIALLEEQGRKCLGIFDDNQKLWGTKLWDIPITGPIVSLPDKQNISAVIAIGNNEVRRNISKNFMNVRWDTLVHPHAWIHKSVTIKEGTVIFAGVVIQPDTVLGAHTIINTSASIDHDCRIGNFCHIAPGCHLAGGVQMGDCSFLGVNSAVLPCINISSDIVVGANGVVINDLLIPGTYVGVPVNMVVKK